MGCIPILMETSNKYSKKIIMDSTPLPPSVFCPLLKKSSDDPYLKLLDFSQLLVADTHMIFFFQKFSLHPLTALFGHPVQKYHFIFCFYQKIFLQALVEIIFRYH